MVLVLHLLTLFTHCPHVHALLVNYYRQQQPGMPSSWYAVNVRYLIRAFPQAMQHCTTALQHHQMSLAHRYCP